MSILKDRIRNKELLCGTHININDPSVGVIVGKLGFDYIWIDMEHSYLSYENLLNHIIAIQGCGTPVIVRIPMHDFTAAKKIIEMGPDGVVFPMVRSKEEADELISYTLYPPYGTRGFGPHNAVGFGNHNTKEYVANNHKEMCRFIQIEHKDLVDDLENVIQNPYIDGYIFGANDLSGSIGELMNTFGENTQALIKKSIEILNKHDKYIGISIGENDSEIIEKWHNLGIHMISSNSDFRCIYSKSKETLDNLKKFHLGK